MKRAYIAVDLGGGSGRVIAGTVAGDTLHLDEIYRFTNRQVRLGGHIYWNFLSLFDAMTTGLRKTVEAGYQIESIGIDTWGVDFGLIDPQGNLLGNPVCYRDPGVKGCAADFFNEYCTETEHYAESGIQIMDINSAFRLVKMLHTAPEMLKAADRILFTPDLFSYFLTGKANNEYTIATTSGLIDARTRSWNRKLIKRCNLPERIFGEIVMPGTVRGHLTEDFRQQIGVDYDIPVIAVGSHDTASAVYATGRNYANDRTAYLSSGTWSLLGVTLEQPILSEEAHKAGFTNEGGIDGSIRFLQNITGLWILQQLIGQWTEKGLPTDYPTLLSEAEKADITTTIDVDDPTFHSPASMIGAITDYCTKQRQRAPQTQGEFVKVVIRSLATRYRKGIEGLNSLLPYPIERLQIIGGGSRNSLLNKLTAEATGLELISGPVEATAIGNILLQAKTAGIINSPLEIKNII